MTDTLVIVESPSKAKTLKKYLGPGYEVLASYGHVRDLVPKSGAVDVEHGFAMKYQLIDRNAKHVDAIARAAKKAGRILLATDPDREGEAIAWHISEILGERMGKKLPELRRIVFYEITQNAVKEATAHPRDVAIDLVNAQQARRALDYLVGFNISPVLWKKISPGLSAGRVQSPALRMIVERELEIEAFTSREYWSLHLDTHKAKAVFTARLTNLSGKKVEQFDISAGPDADAIVARLSKHKEATVQSVERKKKTRHPAPPFTTSTLQQESVRKLGLTTDRTMRTAQQLYEGIDVGSGTVGLITYMRTDSTHLAGEALDEIRQYIGRNYAPDSLPKSAVLYRSQAKNAQEAHEAIRPTSIARTPAELASFLTHDQLRLYEMIWKRTLASQMTPAVFDTVAVDLSLERDAVFRATGQTLTFPGFIAVYLEGADDAESEEGEAKLPALAEGERLPVDRIFGEQHFTQPPPRFTEASLVKTLEEYGIGRPSTYAAIISTLLDREYANLDKKRLVPTPMGRLVNCFLTRHFFHYVDYDFTANLENSLDDVSNGKRTHTGLLTDFWKDLESQLKDKEGVDRGCPTEETCPKCGKHPLYLQASKRGLFYGCAGYPACDYTRPFGRTAIEHAEGPPPPLGQDPGTGLDVRVLNGRFGWYVQLGEAQGKEKPRRASVPKGVPPESVTLANALTWLSLPRPVGIHPETKKPIVANIGRFGPYLLHDGQFKSIPKADDVYTVGLARALEILAMPRAPRGDAAGGGERRELGAHPEDGKSVVLMSGRYGWYAKHGNVNATLPKNADPATYSLPEALALIAEKAAKGPAKRPARRAPAPRKKSA